MTNAELAVVAALAASALTGGTSLGVVWLREWLRGRAADRDVLAAAVTELLSRSMAVSLRYQALGEMMKQRSGLGEGADVALRQRKPLDHFELHDFIDRDVAPLNAAWSVIWTRGDQELIRLANKLVANCADLMGVSTARMPAATTLTRMRRFVVGERWTPEMQADLERARRDMAHARKDLAVYARSVLGLPPAELFGHEPAEPESTARADSQSSPSPETLTHGNAPQPG